VPPSIHPWATRFESEQKMLAFKSELSSSCAECDASTPRTDLLSIERIPPFFGLNRHRSEIDVDCSTRRRMRAKALELGMMAVSLRRASEYRAGEQALSPERNQTFGVEVLGMECPETHFERLTMKLRGRPEAQSERQGRTLSCSARGANQTPFTVSSNDCWKSRRTSRR
jgi:hypothetical protein